MTKHIKEFTLFGHDFQVVVNERDGDRRIQLISNTDQRDKGHSYIIHRDERKSKDGTIFRSGSGLPPRGEHVAEATHEGIQKWLRQESEERSFEKEVEQAIESTVEIWRQNFDKAENFK